MTSKINEMEDNLKKNENGNNINYFEKLEWRPHFFLKIEDDLNFLY